MEAQAAARIARGSWASINRYGFFGADTRLFWDVFGGHFGGLGGHFGGLGAILEAFWRLLEALGGSGSCFKAVEALGKS